MSDCFQKEIYVNDMVIFKESFSTDFSFGFIKKICRNNKIFVYVPNKYYRNCILVSSMDLCKVENKESIEAIKFILER